MIRREPPKSGRMDKMRRGPRKHLGYRQQFSGSPWQHGGPNFGMNQMGMPGHMMNNFGPGFGGNPMAFGNAMAQGMMSGFGKNHGGFGGMSFGGNMGMMGHVGGMGVGYMNSSQSRQGSRMRGGYRQNFSRNQMMPRKRPLIRNQGGPRSKRFAGDFESRSRNRMRRDKKSRESREGSRPDYRKERRRKEKKSDDDEDDDDKDDDELYNPAEPTQDGSDHDSEAAEGEPAEGQDGEKTAKEGDKDTEAKTEGQESTGDGTTPKKSDKEAGKGEKDKAVLQVTIQHGTKGRSVKDRQGSGGSSKKLFCHACKLTCTTQEKFRSHMNSKGHKMRMETLLVLQREKTHDLEARMKASDHLRSNEMRDRRGKSSRRGGNWCTVCETSFPGSFLVHRRTKEHRRKRDKKYPKCRPCRIGFSDQEDYKEHCATEDHKQKSAEFYAVRGQSPGSGSDDDDDYVTVDATGIFEDDEDKMDEKEHAEDGEGKTEEGTEGKGKDEKPPVGQSYVIPIQGFYCKLCRKYFKDQNTAKILHCRANIHVSNYKYKLRALERERKEKEAAEARKRRSEKSKSESKEAAKKAAKEEGGKEKSNAVGQDAEKAENSKGKEEENPEGKTEENAESKAEGNEVKTEGNTEGKNEESKDKSQDTETATSKTGKSKTKSGGIDMMETEDDLAKDLEETAEATEGQVISSLVSESSEQENSELVASLSSQIATEPAAEATPSNDGEDDDIADGEDYDEDEGNNANMDTSSPQTGGKSKGQTPRGRGRGRGKGKRR